MVLKGITKKVLAINLPDQFGPTGTYNYLLDYHGLTGVKIAKRIEKIYEKINNVKKHNMPLFEKLDCFEQNTAFILPNNEEKIIR